jgi:ornithine carbamoyltransferase
MTRHLIDIDDLTGAELDSILSLAAEYKAEYRDGVAHTDLDQQSLGMLFQQPSTRTRVSFETGMTQLGGHAVFLGEDDLQLGRGEPLRDTARALSCYVDFLLARVFTHANVETLAEYADVPVINGLTDDAHPCQTLADLLTIRELHGDNGPVSATWIGDGNNVAQSFALGCALSGIDLTIATPDGYGLDDDVLARARELGGDPTVVDDPETAVEGADVVYTDVWVSMGRTDERDVRLAEFEGYQLDTELLEAAPDAAIMHCLPAHRGEEITDAVIESGQAAIWQQAENRLHAQKGLLLWLSQQG